MLQCALSPHAKLRTPLHDFAQRIEPHSMGASLLDLPNEVLENVDEHIPDKKSLKAFMICHSRLQAVGRRTLFRSFKVRTQPSKPNPLQAACQFLRTHEDVKLSVRTLTISGVAAGTDRRTQDWGTVTASMVLLLLREVPLASVLILEMVNWWNVGRSPQEIAGSVDAHRAGGHSKALKKVVLDRVGAAQGVYGPLVLLLLPHVTAVHLTNCIWPPTADAGPLTRKPSCTALFVHGTTSTFPSAIPGSCGPIVRLSIDKLLVRADHIRGMNRMLTSFADTLEELSIRTTSLGSASIAASYTHADADLTTVLGGPKPAWQAGFQCLRRLRTLRLAIQYPAIPSRDPRNAVFVWRFIPTVATLCPATAAELEVIIDLSTLPSARLAKAYVAHITWEELGDALHGTSITALRIHIAINLRVAPHGNVNVLDCEAVWNRLGAAISNGRQSATLHERLITDDEHRRSGREGSLRGCGKGGWVVMARRSMSQYDLERCSTNTPELLMR